jgi:hypothetical protein
LLFPFLCCRLRGGLFWRCSLLLGLQRLKVLRVPCISLIDQPLIKFLLDAPAEAHYSDREIDNERIFIMATITEALDSGLYSSVLKYDSDRMKRHPIPSAVTVLMVSSGAPSFLPEGSAMLVLMPKGKIKGFVAAAQAGDSSAWKGLEPTLTAKMPSTKFLPAAEAAAVVIGQEQYAELYAGGQFIAGGLFLPKGIPALQMTLPYTGGTLEKGELRLLTFAKNVDDAPLYEVAVVAHEAQLTAAEKAALMQVGPDYQIGAAGGTVNPMCTPAAFAATVTAGLVGAAVGYALGRVLGHMLPDWQALPISESEIAKLGSGLTAARLLEIRRNALMQAD